MVKQVIYPLGSFFALYLFLGEKEKKWLVKTMS